MDVIFVVFVLSLPFSCDYENVSFQERLEMLFKRSTFFGNLKLRLGTLIWFMCCSGVAGAETEALDPRLLEYSRHSLNLSLCAVVFEEEHGEKTLAGQYQNGSSQAEALIHQGGWRGEEVLEAHELVLQEDFSFTLPLDTTWGAFRKTYFSRQLCDEALTYVESQSE